MVLLLCRAERIIRMIFQESLDRLHHLFRLSSLTTCRRAHMMPFRISVEHFAQHRLGILDTSVGVGDESRTYRECFADRDESAVGQNENQLGVCEKIGEGDDGIQFFGVGGAENRDVGIFSRLLKPSDQLFTRPADLRLIILGKRTDDIPGDLRRLRPFSKSRIKHSFSASPFTSL